MKSESTHFSLFSWLDNNQKSVDFLAKKKRTEFYKKWKIAIYRKWRFLGNLTKYRNLQIMNCDIGRDVIHSPPARKEYRNLQIYLEKSQLSQLSQKSQISQFMLSLVDGHLTNGNTWSSLMIRVHHNSFTQAALCSLVHYLFWDMSVLLVLSSCS